MMCRPLCSSLRVGRCGLVAARITANWLAALSCTTCGTLFTQTSEEALAWWFAARIARIAANWSWFWAANGCWLWAANWSWFWAANRCWLWAANWSWLWAADRCWLWAANWFWATNWLAAVSLLFEAAKQASFGLRSGDGTDDSKQSNSQDRTNHFNSLQMGVCLSSDDEAIWGEFTA